MIKLIKKNGLILGGFALVTTSIIALTYSFTAKPIALAKERQLLTILNQVVAANMHDNDLHIDCLELEPHELLGNRSQRVFRSRLDGKNTALIIETTAPDGYSGAIDLVVAIDTQQTVLSARVTAHKETPGLGDKIELRISDWILSFENVIYNEAREERWRVRKDGGQFDQFTGATITPRSVVQAVKNAAIYGQKNMQTLFDSPSNCPRSANLASLETQNTTDEALNQ